MKIPQKMLRLTLVYSHLSSGLLQVLSLGLTRDPPWLTPPLLNLYTRIIISLWSTLYILWSRRCYFRRPLRLKRFNFQFRRQTWHFNPYHTTPDPLHLLLPFIQPPVRTRIGHPAPLQEPY